MASDDELDTAAPRGNFIRDIVDADLASGKHAGVVTRFPPEPNGYLHIGHAKSICLNFGLARDYGGRCHLRMDDTNPTTEDMEYVDAIKRDIAWLGFDWGEHLYFASDYFERLYQMAVHMIRTGAAYVDSLSESEIRQYRGTVTEPGRLSPHRERAVAESLDLFERMRKGEYPDGAHVVRAKIDMASPNMKMRDPPIYRIKHEAHYRTGKAWCIYPLYDFTHCLSDSFEGITHSICTLEFENNRELYDWVLEHTPVTCRPQQTEFARLNLSYTMMSKRKLLELVEDGHVSGWDDPRMPTIAGMRRRGFTPESLRSFADMIGVAKNNSVVDIGKLEFCIRADLNAKAPRVMGVLRPLEVVIENFPEGHVEELHAPYFPGPAGHPHPGVDDKGSRLVPLSRVIYVEQSDFMRDPPKDFHRLAPGRAVRLRHGYVIECREVIENDAGEVTRLVCSYHDGTDGDAWGERKVKGTIHWVSAAHAVDAEVRLYDRLFLAELPDSLDQLNPESLTTLRHCKLEPSLASAPPGSSWQLERQGYFAVDAIDSRPGALVLNRTVTLRDTWAKLQAKRGATPQRDDGRPRRPRPSAPPPTPSPLRAEGRGGGERAPLAPEQAALAERYRAAHALAESDARQIASTPALGKLFDGALSEGADPIAVARWLVNDVSRELRTAGGQVRFAGVDVAEIAARVEDGSISATSAKEVLATLAREGGTARAIIAARGLARLGDDGTEALVDEVLRLHADEVERYRSGKTGLMGFFVGQVMRRAAGKADGARVGELLEKKLSAG